jgi:hypothetical protein
MLVQGLIIVVILFDVIVGTSNSPPERLRFELGWPVILLHRHELENISPPQLQTYMYYGRSIFEAAQADTHTDLDTRTCKNANTCTQTTKRSPIADCLAASWAASSVFSDSASSSATSYAVTPSSAQRWSTICAAAFSIPACSPCCFHRCPSSRVRLSFCACRATW